MKYKVYIEDSSESKPRPHEIAAVIKIAEIERSDMVFMRRLQSKLPDLYFLKTNTRWELKSPLGGGKRTIQNNLREASLHSENVIIDLTRARLTDAQGISRAREFMKSEKTRIKHLKVLTKRKLIVDIK